MSLTWVIHRLTASKPLRKIPLRIRQFVDVFFFHIFIFFFFSIPLCDKKIQQTKKKIKNHAKDKVVVFFIFIARKLLSFFVQMN